MPFAYFGAKHRLARFYPPPQYTTVVEPFAGSAAYACYWAKQGLVKHAILTDINPNVVNLWHRLQKMTEKELFAIPMPIKGERTAEPLIAAASGEQGMAVLGGKTRQITDRMVKAWPRLRQKIIDVLPLIKTWEVHYASYTDIKNQQVTWFVDPPYLPRLGNMEGQNTAGGWRYEKDGGVKPISDYNKLAAWCKNRQGQVIVCEQIPADWLPFQAFRNQRNGVGAGTQSTRTEAIWVK